MAGGEGYGEGGAGYNWKGKPRPALTRPCGRISLDFTLKATGSHQQVLIKNHFDPNLPFRKIPLASVNRLK